MTTLFVLKVSAISPAISSRKIIARPPLLHRWQLSIESQRRKSRQKNGAFKEFEDLREAHAPTAVATMGDAVGKSCGVCRNETRAADGERARQHGATDRRR